MMRKTGFHLIITVILALFLPLTAISEETLEPQRTIETNGKVDISVKPDIAFLFVNIETHAETARKAKDKNAGIVQTVKEALSTKELGLKERDIETSSFTLHQRMVWNERSRKNEMNGYLATHLLKIRVHNLDLVGKILDTSVNAGATGINNILFTLSDEEKKKAKGKALQLASENARAKAEVLTKSLGVSLGRVLSIVEGNGSFTPFRQSNEYKAKNFMMEDAVTTEITPGEVNITADVSIVFELH